MKKARRSAALVLAALVAWLCCVPAVSAANRRFGGVKVAATAENTATNFAADVTAICVSNAGPDAIFFAENAVATATAGVNEIPSGMTVCFDDLDFHTIRSGASVATIGLVCSTDETATAYLFFTIR